MTLNDRFTLLGENNFTVVPNLVIDGPCNLFWLSMLRQDVEIIDNYTFGLRRRLRSLRAKPLHTHSNSPTEVSDEQQ